METRTERLSHLGGIVGALGGIVWIIGLVLAAGQPAATMRTYSPMMLGGLIAMGIGMIAGHLRLTRRTGIMGYMALAVGVLSLIFLIVSWFMVESGVIDVVYFAMAFMLMLVSFLILALMALSSGGVSRPAMLLMIVGLLAMPFMDMRTGMIWQGIVFGAAWVWIGADLLLTRIGRETRVPA
jgi:hypothetical protein